MNNLEKRLSLVITKLSIIQHLEANLDYLEIQTLKEQLLHLILPHLSKKFINYDLVFYKLSENLFDFFESKNVELDDRTIENVADILIGIAKEVNDNGTELYDRIMGVNDLEINVEEDAFEEEIEN